MSTAYFISLPPWKARTRVNCHPFDSCYGHMIVLFLSPGQHLTSSSPVLSKSVELDWFKSICCTWRKKNHYLHPFGDGSAKQGHYFCERTIHYSAVLCLPLSSFHCS